MGKIGRALTLLQMVTFLVISGCLLEPTHSHWNNPNESAPLLASPSRELTSPLLSDTWLIYFERNWSIYEHIIWWPENRDDMTSKFLNTGYTNYYELIWTISKDLMLSHKTCRDQKINIWLRRCYLIKTSLRYTFTTLL